uniref:Putative secreted protein n=1 Tax=Ixodes scapularis TaxID=6945 RepID=A0A4D5RGZ4_IXOSC
MTVWKVRSSSARNKSCHIGGATMFALHVASASPHGGPEWFAAAAHTGSFASCLARAVPETAVSLLAWSSAVKTEGTLQKLQE